MQRFLSVFRPNPSFSASVLLHEQTSNNNILSIKTNKIPVGEKIKISDRYLLDMKEKYDIQRIEIYLY